jgi:AraC-like DNA-binding protein
MTVPWSRVLRFTDPFECQAAIQGGQVELLPTTNAAFRAEITQIGMKKLWMQCFDLAQPLISTATANIDRKVVGFVMGEVPSRLQHCGLEVEPHHMLVYGNDVVHQRSESGVQYATMSVPANDFPTLARTIVGREFLEQSNLSVLRPDPSLMSRVMKLHKAAGLLAHTTPDILLLPEVLRSLETELVHILLRCLAHGAGVEPNTSDRRQSSIMRRFEEFLEANSDRPVYLTEICATVGVAERTLRAACEQHLGMGPIRFLTLRRMHLARAALFRSEAATTTVTRVASDHGFWELGRFSVSYRTLFGESPSETLRRPAKQCAIHLNRPSSLPANEVAQHLN